MKKYLILLYSIIIVPLAVKSQLTVTCGEDLFKCASLYGTPHLNIGANVIVEGGTPPYYYSWWSKPLVFSSTISFTINDYLDDANIKNPQLISHPVTNTPIDFILTVTDSDNNEAMDTISISIGQMVIGMINYNLNIRLGDSIQFFNSTVITGGVPPIKYYWYPVSFLEDSSKVNTWVKPEKNMTYLQYFIDSNGCVSDSMPLYDLTVFPPININEVKNNTILLKQNGNRIEFNNESKNIVTYKFVSITGSIISYGSTDLEYIIIPNILSNYNNVICIISLNSNQGYLKIKN